MLKFEESESWTAFLFLDAINLIPNKKLILLIDTYKFFISDLTLLPKNNLDPDENSNKNYKETTNKLDDSIESQEKVKINKMIYIIFFI